MRSCRLARGSSRAKTGTLGRAGRSCSAWSSLIGPAGQLEHLESADDPAAVVGMKAGRRPGSMRGQTLVERGIAVLEGVALQPQAELAIGARPLEQAAEQRLQVERRTADEENSLAPRLDLAGCLRRPLAIGGDAGRFPGVDDVDQVVRDAAALGERRLGRRDIHPAVQGHRVERDHLGIQPARQGHANSRLARGRRPGQVDRAVKDVLGHRSNQTLNVYVA